MAASVRSCEMKILSTSSPDSYKVISLEENLGPFFSFCVTFSSITPFHVTGLSLYPPENIKNSIPFRFEMVQKGSLMFSSDIEASGMKWVTKCLKAQKHSERQRNIRNNKNI